MRCENCAARCECGLTGALLTLLDYIDNLQIQSKINDIVSDYVEQCEHFESQEADYGTD